MRTLVPTQTCLMRWECLGNQRHEKNQTHGQKGISKRLLEKLGIVGWNGETRGCKFKPPQGQAIKVNAQTRPP